MDRVVSVISAARSVWGLMVIMVVSVTMLRMLVVTTMMVRVQDRWGIPTWSWRDDNVGLAVEGIAPRRRRQARGQEGIRPRRDVIGRGGEGGVREVASTRR